MQRNRQYEGEIKFIFSSTSPFLQVKHCLTQCRERLSLEPDVLSIISLPGSWDVILKSDRHFWFCRGGFKGPAFLLPLRCDAAPSCIIWYRFIYSIISHVLGQAFLCNCWLKVKEGQEVGDWRDSLVGLMHTAWKFMGMTVRWECFVK